jgi:hypothetical protein
VLGCAISIATIVLQSRNIGREEVERMRGGREDDKKRIGWEQRYRVCRGAVGFVGETCSAARRRVVVLKERDVEKGQRGGRVFENLTSSNGEEKDERGGSKAGRATVILKGIGASVFGCPWSTGNRK